MSCYDKKIPKEVSIEYPLYQSEKGKYFIGQTPTLIGSDNHAIAALVNPTTSQVKIYLNAITITNISGNNLSAEFYIRSSFKTGLVSNLFSCTNTDIVPFPVPKGEIQYLSTATQPPNGINIFSRIVSPYTTLVVDGGQIILGPEQSLVVYLGGFLPVVFDSAKVAFGWWEEKTTPCSNCNC